MTEPGPRPREPKDEERSGEPEAPGSSQTPSAAARPHAEVAPDRRARTAHVPDLGLAAARGGAVGAAGLVLAAIASVDGVEMFVGGAAGALTLGLATAASVVADRRLARSGAEPTFVPWATLALGACAAAVDAVYAAGVLAGGPERGVEAALGLLRSGDVLGATLLGASLFASAAFVARPEERPATSIWPAGALAVVGTLLAWFATIALAPGSRAAEMLPISAAIFAVVYGLPTALVLALLFRVADRLALWRWPPGYLGVEASSSRSE